MESTRPRADLGTTGADEVERHVLLLDDERLVQARLHLEEEGEGEEAEEEGDKNGEEGEGERDEEEKVEEEKVEEGLHHLHELWVVEVVDDVFQDVPESGEGEGDDEDEVPPVGHEAEGAEDDHDGYLLLDVRQDRHDPLPDR